MAKPLNKHCGSLTDLAVMCMVMRSSTNPRKIVASTGLLHLDLPHPGTLNSTEPCGTRPVSGLV